MNHEILKILIYCIIFQAHKSQIISRGRGFKRADDNKAPDTPRIGSLYRRGGYGGWGPVSPRDSNEKPWYDNRPSWGVNSLPLASNHSRERHNHQDERNDGRFTSDDDAWNTTDNNDKRHSGRNDRRFTSDDDEGLVKGFKKMLRDDDTMEDNRKAETEQKPKEIYIPEPPTEDESIMYGSCISAGINFNHYDDINVLVSGSNAPKPITSFESSNLRKLVLDNLQKCQYTKVTPVQKYSIPIILGGRDLMACAQTGSGKTAAFLLPIVTNLLEAAVDLDTSCCAPQCIILSPTRELSIQIYENARKFARGSFIQCENVYGGTSVRHQIERLRRGCHILTATPGRFCDFLSRGRIKLHSVRFVVLDEADRMLQDNFLQVLSIS